MKSLIIFDNEGNVVFTKNGSQNEVELSHLIVDLPEGKMLIGINIETGEPIFADIPPSEIESLRGDLENAIVELSMLISMGGQ